MRSGEAWPVIFSNGKTVISLPTGWKDATGTMTNLKGVHAISSPSGDVAVYSVEPLGSAYVSSPSGWSSLGTGGTYTYDSAGKLWKVDRSGNVSYRSGTTWYSFSSLPGAPKYEGVSISVAGNGEVGVATVQGGSMLTYYHYNSLTGWTSSANLLPTGPVGGIAPFVSLAFDSRNIPHIVSRSSASNNPGVAYDFNVVLGKWAGSYLPSAGTGMHDMALVSDGQGKVGTAFVNPSENRLYYCYNDNNSGWVSIGLPIGGPLPWSGPNPTGDGASLAYDFDGTPVIAYISGNMWLAYDPVVPEPMTLALLAAGAMMLRRRRA
jgi:hypothetical protein